MVKQTDSAQQRIVPHARTLRNAREQVKQMVNDGFSTRRIKSYLGRWCSWWVRSSESWQYQELLRWFLEVCRDANAAAIAAELLGGAIAIQTDLPAGSDFHAIA